MLYADLWLDPNSPTVGTHLLPAKSVENMLYMFAALGEEEALMLGW